MRLVVRGRSFFSAWAVVEVSPEKKKFEAKKSKPKLWSRLEGTIAHTFANQKLR